MLHVSQWNIWVISVLRKMVPKWWRAYTQGWDKRSGWVDAPGGQKVTVTKYSAGRKKLWLVSHKMRFFRVSKVFWPTPVLDKHVKCCLMLRTKHQITQLWKDAIGYTTRMNGHHWWRWYSTIIFSIFEPNIFGCELSVPMFSWFPMGTLWKV